MAHHWSEGVSTLRFTAREFQQDLVEEALKHNLLTCPPTLAATFVALKVIQELAYQIRRPSRKKTVVLTPIYRIKDTASEISHLSDLVAVSLISIDDCNGSLDLFDNCEVIVCTTEVFEYLLSNNFLSILMINLLIIEECHMVTIDADLKKIISRYLEMKSKENNQHNLPRILAFTYPLFTNCDTKNSNNDVHDIKSIIERHSENMPMDRATLFNTNEDNIEKENPHAKCLENFTDLVCLETDKEIIDMNSFKYWSVPCAELPCIEKEPEPLITNVDNDSKTDNQDVFKISMERTMYDKLEYQLEKLENLVCCNLDMASDIVGLKRITGKPKEVIVECKEISEEEKSHDQLQLETFMKSTVAGALIFLDDHRYDPTEIYGDEAFGEELRAIPDPRTEPREMLELFLYILEEAGPYAADKAAFVLLIKIEKLKIKIPYERHFLLLCLVTSIFIQIRAAAELIFGKISSDKEKISKFSTPKICRLIDILRLFKPSESIQKGLHSVSNSGSNKTLSESKEKHSSTEETVGKIQNKKSDIQSNVRDSKKNSIRPNSDILKKNDHNLLIEDCQSPKKSEKSTDFQNSNPKSSDIDDKSIGSSVQAAFEDSSSDNSTQIVCQKKCDNISSASCKTNVKIFNSNSQTISNSSELSSNICDVSDKILDDTFAANETSDNEKTACKNVPKLNGSVEQIENCDFIKLEHELQMNCDKLMNNESANNNKNIIDNLKKSFEKVSIENSVQSENISELNVPLSTSPKVNCVGKNKKYNKSDNSSNGKQSKKQDNLSQEKSTTHVIMKDNLKTNTNDFPCKKIGEGNFRGRGRGRGGKSYGFQGRYHYNQNNDPDALCGLIFVNEPLIAKILSTVINEFCRSDDELRFVCAQYTVDKIADPVTDPKEAETEHKLQEEVLKRFRIHECNLLVGTSILEEGMDLPKCNLVIRWDLPNGYRSYARCRARARAPRSLYAMLVRPPAEHSINMLAHFSYIERMLVKKCGWFEPPATEEADAARFSSLIEPYRPAGAAVNLSSAVALLNRYCVKLPSDTFTRLVPLWSMETVNFRGYNLYICTIRLPINCPLKHHIVGHPMPNRVLARRVAALQACRALHKVGELDDNLMPIGKEGFRATESDWLSLPPPSDLPKSMQMNLKDPKDLSHVDSMDYQSQFDFSSHFEPRPGTTKRKQYYYKKVAHAFSGCRPSIGKPCLAYYISAWLACPLPERHNTRGRKLHPPEAYAEGFAILTSKPIQQIPVFPIFTRSGEVRVALEKLPFNVMISHRRRRLIHYFMKYTFAEVLRVHNHLMIFDESGKQNRNSYYIVPTLKVPDNDGNTSVIIDWNFLQLIYDQTNSETLSYHDPSNTNIMESEENSIELIENNDKKPICEKTVCKNCCNVIESLPKNSSDIFNKLSKSPTCKNNDLIENVSDKIEDLSIDDAKIEINEIEMKNHSLCNKCLHNNEKNTLVEENTPSIENENEKNENSNDAIVKSEKTENDAVNERNPVEVLPNPYLSLGETFIFDSEKYRDAVVMPWYRNQDQPQYFYVAEICRHLSPRSAFPSEQHDTFEEYYKHKYGVRITQSSQPLLDVDHTSARLNLLTPRFVNRKGVALPTSSERTKRAKRESLEQKQILVPELCCTHPFRGALWRAAVALPCILYRLNSLLLADEIRKSVALRVALGVSKPEEDFKWPALDFGWSLAEVLAGENAKELKIKTDSEHKEVQPEIKIENSESDVKNESENKESEDVNKEKTANEILKDMEDAEEGLSDGAFEIGTWSNDMAATVPSAESESQDYEDDELISATTKLPGNLTICTPVGGGADWSLSDKNPPPSPKIPSRAPQQRKYSMADSDASYVSSDFEESDDGDNSSDSDSDDYNGGVEPMEKLSEKGGKHTIIYKSGNEAEAIEIPSIAVQKKSSEIVIDPEIQKIAENKSISVFQSYFYSQDNEDNETLQHIEKFKESIELNKTQLKNNGILISHDSCLDHIKIQATVDTVTSTEISTYLNNTKKKLSNITYTISNNSPPSDILQSDQNDTEKPIIKVDNAQANQIVWKQNRFSINNQLAIHKSNVCDGIDNKNPFPELFDIALSKNEVLQLYKDMFPYEKLPQNEPNWFDCGLLRNGCITLDDLELNKRKILNEIKKCILDGGWIKFNFFSMKDLDENDFGIDFPKKQNELKSIEYKYDGSIVSNITESNHNPGQKPPMDSLKPDNTASEFSFSFDHQPNLNNHPGPSPSLILQALTMSNANDGINLERLETIGDSFLKYAITTYLYCTYQNIHEGKLSHLRSKQVSNLNLYRLGRKKSLGSRMVAYKFEPHDNWLPPCHRVPPHLERALIDTNIPSSLWNIADMPPLTGLSKDEIEKLVKERVASYHSAPANFHCSLNKKNKDENCPLHGKSKRNLNMVCNTIHEDVEKTKSETVDIPKESPKCTCTVMNCTTISKRLDSDKDISELKEGEYVELEGVPCFVPYNLITQHSIPDKSVADCVEALIGAYLIECGPRGALLFMAWLGIRVLPKEEIILSPDHPFVKMMESAKLKNSKCVNHPKNADSDMMNSKVDEDDVSDDDIGSDCDQDSEKDYEVDPYDNQDENSDFDEDDSWNWEGRIPGSLKPEKNEQGQWVQVIYGELKSPPSPLLRYVPDPEGELMQMLSGYEGLERTLGYRFKDRCYLLQAMTHASYSPNRLTDCYQRLEFLGDAVLDYLITRQLYEDPRRHSPGALTDLRSALVNNTIFASLAVRHGMHKYFRHLSPGLNEVLARFVKIQEENGHSISEEHYLIQEDECEQAEDVEVPKALGDLFESVAGAIFLDSGMSLDAVWKVYHALMQREIEAFSESVPKSPVRELLEMEPETAKFGKPEKLADGRRVRVTVEVLGAGAFKGVGRNYRIAKCTAAKCALRRLAPSGTRRHNK